MGDKDSVETMQRLFTRGNATKEDFSKALKGYQDAIEEMESKDRDQGRALIDAANKKYGRVNGTLF